MDLIIVTLCVMGIIGFIIFVAVLAGDLLSSVAHTKKLNVVHAPEESKWQTVLAATLAVAAVFVLAFALFWSGALLTLVHMLSRIFPG